VLWGAWLLTLAAVFSWTTTINSYYTAALAPAVAALLGTGVVAMWADDRTAPYRRIGLAVVLAGTLGYGAWLVDSAPTAPGWLQPLVIVVGVAAIGTVVASLVRRTDVVLAAALTAALVAGVLAPAVASATIVTRGKGAFDTPFQSAGASAAIDQLFIITPAQVAGIVPKLETVQDGAPYLLAVQTSAVASVFIYASGGFTGTIPSPTLSQLKADIRQGLFHLVLAAPSKDPRLRWIAAHCLKVGKPKAGLNNYFCTKASAG
jgi:hypothetical protein